MPTQSAGSANPNEAALTRTLRFIAEGIIRGRHCSRRPEVWLRYLSIAVSVIFSCAGAAGLIATKREALPAAELSPAFLTALGSLIVVILSELYRAFGVEKTALQALAARSAFSLVEVKTKHALEKPNPLADIEKVLKQAHSLEEMFHQILPAAPDDEVEALVQNLLVKYRPQGGWSLPISQQKPKRKGGDS